LFIPRQLVFIFFGGVPARKHLPAPMGAVADGVSARGRAVRSYALVCPAEYTLRYSAGQTSAYRYHPSPGRRQSPVTNHQKHTANLHEKCTNGLKYPQRRRPEQVQAYRPMS